MNNFMSFLHRWHHKYILEIFAIRTEFLPTNVIKQVQEVNHDPWVKNIIVYQW